MRANLGRFCYLLMLVPVPESLESDDLRVYPIGDRLYTTARMEFDKQYFKSLDQTLGNIKSRADFAFMQEQKKLLRKAEKAVEQSERKISDMERRLKELDDLLMVPENAADMTLVTEYTTTKKALDEEVERWERLSEELESINQ
jgi:vacuolar-type H+-ATPase subunit I/STV1